MAKRSNRVQRPQGELRKELVEQVALLRHACDAYDKGLIAAAKHIALSLRVLLHHKGQSRALLDQLGMRHGRFMDTAGPLNPHNLLPECNLVMMRMSTVQSESVYLPRLEVGWADANGRRLFPAWWTEPVVKDKQNRKFSRMDLVLNVADTDGGAHFDPELDEAYAALSRDNSLGWMAARGDKVIGPAFDQGPHFACTRQIAHELLVTLQERFPEACGRA